MSVGILGMGSKATKHVDEEAALVAARRQLAELEAAAAQTQRRIGELEAELAEPADMDIGAEMAKLERVNLELEAARRVLGTLGAKTQSQCKTVVALEEEERARALAVARAEREALLDKLADSLEPVAACMDSLRVLDSKIGELNQGRMPENWYNLLMPFVSSLLGNLEGRWNPQQFESWGPVVWQRVRRKPQ